MQKRKSKLKYILIAILVFIAILFLSTFAFVSISYISTPLDIEALSSTSLGIEIYDNTSSSTPISYSSNKKIISTSQLNSYTINAFIAIEDKRFYSHNGYDLKRIVKAGLVNLKSGSKSQGASTITQQLVKNILLNSEKTYSRKFKEILLSIKTEKNFTKEEILNMYLNSIYFGSNAYGIESASNLYFDKSASELTLNESAILAGLIKSPAYYSPINHPDNCFARKNIVLNQMYENGYISKEEYEENINKEVNISFKKNNYDNSYNHQAIIEACNLLNITEKELLRQELKLYTYMDNDLQLIAEKAMMSTNIDADKISLIVDNSGKVLAYCGDSYFDLSKMKRNPASTIKPLVVYMPAIANNIVSPLTPILDEKITEGYSPNNAGGHYLGWTSVREALAHSSNVCSVKLLNKVGLDVACEYANKFHLGNISNPTESLALGDIENGVSIINLARAYSILQNNGIDKGLTFISRIEDSYGNILYQDSDYSNKVFEQEDCMLINDMLKTSAQSGTAKRLNELPFEVASKTGTAQIQDKNTDLWNIAYTTEHLVLSWCGDASSKGLEQNYSSSFYPTMINKKILENIYTSHTPKNFELNENIVKVAVDSIEYNNLHNLASAPENLAEMYKIYDIFKIQNIPEESSTCEIPDLQFNVSLTTKGAKIELNYNPIFEYQIFRKTENSSNLIGGYTDVMIDDKVFKYKNVQYYAIATNKYTKEKFTSPTIKLNPEEFLVNILNERFIKSQQTKTKWYI